MLKTAGIGLTTPTRKARGSHHGLGKKDGGRAIGNARVVSSMMEEFP